MSKFSHKISKMTDEQKDERLDARFKVYSRKIGRLCYLENYIPLKLLQLQHLKELRAPKRVIDASLWCIEMRRRELRRLRAWKAQKSTRNYGMHFDLLLPTPKAHPFVTV